MSESGHTVEFEFDGRTITAKSGQSMAGALHDAGIKIVSRSFKYHRPRGLFCMTGRCPNCLCNVDGEPNVRICTEPVRSGAVVHTQNAWPSVQRDALGILDKFDEMMPVGFYYKSMHKPRWAWPIAEKMVRKIAGLGVVDFEHGGDKRYQKTYQHTDVAVVGGGIAGMYAALFASFGGCRVTLIDDQDQLGGHRRCDPRLGMDHWQSLAEQIQSSPNIDTIQQATAFGAYQGGLLGIQRGDELIKLRTQSTIYATGGWERPLLFENNDLPGVLLASAAQRLVHLDSCRLDGPVLVVTDNPQGYRAAKLLVDTGHEVVGICDLNERPVGEVLGVPRFAATTIYQASGKRQVTGATLRSLDGTTEQPIRCSWIVQAVGFTLATGLPYQDGCQFDLQTDVGQPSCTRSPAGVALAGAVNGYFDPVAAAFDGRRAGVAAAQQHGRLSFSTDPLDDYIAEQEIDYRNHCFTGIVSDRSPAKKNFVCLCEDVTEKDIRDAVDEGYDNIETLKRYSTVCMGPCQGKMCQMNSIQVCAEANGQTFAETGRTTSRPPEQPVPLGVLAGRAVDLQLERRTAIHHWHVSQGASFLDAGAWKRPEHYGDPSGEYSAVRNACGLVDVSTLGKIELSGFDVPDFLEFVYPNRFAKLGVGRVRYGVLCDESGILIDDGTIARFGEREYFLTATTGNADAVDSWFRWWLKCRPEWDVRLTNLTAALAGMNLAGPLSRKVLSKVCKDDLSAASLPYLAARKLTVAGVEARVLRIGFVGELGYEIHVPSQYGLHVWETLMDAGAAEGIRAFGVEAQRRLRLDKQHLLPGVDTDALSTPWGAHLPWIVKLDKPDFIGRATLARFQESPDQLVGFRMEGREPPDEASLVVIGDQLSGRITSARYSPVTDCVIGLAWVKTEQANNGEEIQLKVNGRNARAVVQTDPFYDPNGEKLRS